MKEEEETHYWSALNRFVMFHDKAVQGHLDVDQAVNNIQSCFDTYSSKLTDPLLKDLDRAKERTIRRLSQEKDK